MERPSRSVYTATDFIQWRAAKALSLSPKFQRRGVWKTAARSFFIDTLLRRMPVPPIYIRVTQSAARDRVVREVIDGQQRVAAVLDFMDGQYRLSKNLNAPWAKRTFEELTPEQQDQIRTYEFSAEVFHGISDLQVLEVFSRLNTYSVPLNAQELRNGRFFGYFKQTVFELAHEHLEFWRRHRVFTEQSIARMLEAEFVSELLIAQLVGMQDKKKSVDSFYEQHDEEFEQREQVQKRFRDTIDAINDTFPDGLGETEFRRSPLLYSLFCAVYHRRYGLPEAPLETSRKPITRQERLSLKEAVDSLSEKIERGRAKKPVPQAYAKFVTACLSQTDNIKPRMERFRVIYKAAFL